jgi:hypothetical protein
MLMYLRLTEVDLVKLIDPLMAVKISGTTDPLTKS